MKNLAGFRRRAKELQRILESSKRKSLENLLSTIDEHTAASEIQHKLKDYIGPSNKLRQGLGPLPALRQANGAACRSADEILTRWIAFFADMEGGQRIGALDLHQCWTTALLELGQPQQQLVLSDLPSLCALEAACRRTKAGKASGPDAIPSELCKHHPQAVAMALFPLMLKIISHGHEALLHKGG